MDVQEKRASGAVLVQPQRSPWGQRKGFRCREVAAALWSKGFNTIPVFSFFGGTALLLLIQKPNKNRDQRRVVSFNVL